MSLLEEHTARCAHPEQEEVYSICVDVSTVGWGCLVPNSRVVCCAFGLWSADLLHKKFNELEAETLAKTLGKFRPYIYTFFQ